MQKDLTKRKKLNLSVKREFQKWLLLQMVGQVLLSSLVAAAILYFYARHEITDSFYTAHVSIRRVSDLLLPVIVAGSAVSLCSAFLVALFLPQKIAGPLYRIGKRLEALQQGDLNSEIRLRRNDILQDLAATLNDSTSVIKNRIKAAQDNQAEIERSMQSAAVNAELRDAVNQLKENLALFKT